MIQLASMKTQNLLRILTGFCVLIVSVLLYLYWVHALFQEFGWLETTLTTVLIMLAGIVVGVGVNVAFGSVPFKTYMQRYGFVFMLMMVALGLIVPVLFYATVFLNPQTDDCLGVVHFCLDLSGIDYVKTMIALLISIETCAVLVGAVFRTNKAKPRKKTK
jgi:hypothetical protein